MHPHHMPEHDHIACSVCGRIFTRPWNMMREGTQTCATCVRPQASRGGYEPMVQIESGEHQRLLHLYYALFEHEMTPSAQTSTALYQAIQRCNKYFEGGSSCH
ncbi:hypothetical protein N1030_17360 [Desulfovibrio mangrovi]|uniref:hypothetical protein n=1 Tax=Desulfovibrio mangrovi TaxID=2976983 RepID=UPI002247AA63|nr:hypothetical protein [Desulfovibrio mangrovi]UZP67342.1 hypothetical protein N1030_17360 [Desulfovibrio mangrovi]